MARCVICDRSTDIENYHLIHLSFSKRENGYVCEDCNYEIFSSIEELEQDDESQASRVSNESSSKL